MAGTLYVIDIYVVVMWFITVKNSDDLLRK